MEHINGFLLIALVWSSASVSIWLWNRKRIQTGLFFLLSNRTVGLGMGALSVAAAWVWAPALFVASQKAYELGLPGLFWFTFPNVLALILFSFLAARMKKIFDCGYTLPEYMYARFDRRLQITYTGAIFIVQIYSVILQITAALLLLNLVTGIDKWLLIVILASCMLSLSLMAGFRSSLVVDSMKAFTIASIGVLLVPWSIKESGGLATLAQGIGDVAHLFDPTVAWTFGIPISISLLSGVVIDQQQWQRAFAMRKSITQKSFLLGAFFFAFVPISLGLLGFAAAGSHLTIPADQAQLIGVHFIQRLLPEGGVVLFTVMVLTGLLAAGMSALSAASSVGAIDLLRFVKPDADDATKVRVARITMIVISCIAMGIALIPHIQLVYLLLLIGVFRAALMVPTVLSLYWKKLSPQYTFLGIILGIAIGMPIFLYGSIYKIPSLASLGSVMPILVSSVVSIVGSLFKPSDFDYETRLRTADSQAV